MKKILVAFDGSEGAELAIRDMRHAGFGDRAEAKVLTLADVWLPRDKLTAEQLAEHPSFVEAHELAAAACQQAHKTAIEGARLLHGIFPAWTITNEAEAESPAWGILTEAAKWQADLIVIGSHGRNLLEKVFLGSVSAKVAAEAPCSVRVVRAQKSFDPAHGNLLIALDGSPDSEVALKEALSREWPERTVAHLVSVVDDKSRTRLLKSAAAGKAAVGIEDKLLASLQEARGKFAAKGLAAETHLLEGDPKNKILSLAQNLNAAAIFMGACGMDHKQRLFLGTLASAICTRAHCTVEIVRGMEKVNSTPGL